MAQAQPTADDRIVLYGSLMRGFGVMEPLGTEAWAYLYNRSPARTQRIAAGDWRSHHSAHVDQ